MTETNITRAITGLIVAALIWSISSTSALIASDGMQEVHIRNNIESQARLVKNQILLGQRVAHTESNVHGLSVSIDIVIKNQDRILNKLDGR